MTRAANPDRRRDSRAIDDRQTQHKQEEYRNALRALLMQPLMTSRHTEFAAVRRHADGLRAWFARETGWNLHIERDCARLYKRPADLADATRGLPGFDRRRYVLLCLAAAVLERAEPQITLRALGDRLLALAGEPALTERGFGFALENIHERRELVAVCRSLLDWGVLARVAGDEENYIHGNGGAGGDALYDVQRRVLAGLLAAVRGPSTWAPEAAPRDLDERLAALVAEHVAEGDEGRRTALRHHLSRRLLDDPVIYFDELDAETRAYLTNQRGPMAARLCEDSGLIPEQRAEGVALIDEAGLLTDAAMPAEGTEAHVTMLVAEFLAGRLRQATAAPVTADADAATPRATAPPAAAGVSDDEVAAFIRTTVADYGRYWRKSAREPGGERELAAAAVSRLAMLRLIGRADGWVRPLPALARIALGDTTITTANAPPRQLALV